jgi:hypothetical protein
MIRGQISIFTHMVLPGKTISILFMYSVCSSWLPHNARGKRWGWERRRGGGRGRDRRGASKYICMYCRTVNRSVTYLCCCRRSGYACLRGRWWWQAWLGGWWHSWSDYYRWCLHNHHNNITTQYTNNITTRSKLPTIQSSNTQYGPKKQFGLVVRVAGWHAGNPGLILGRDGLYTFGCTPQCFRSDLAEILRYINTFT